MGNLLNIAKRLHTDFDESGTTSLDRQTTLELLELVTELAVQVEHLSHNRQAEGQSVGTVLNRNERASRLSLHQLCK